jgi:PAS domain S-box-containing protein
MEVVEEVLRESSLEKGALPSTANEDACDHLREHNEALIRKLESKMLQLEEANRRLERELTERRQVEAELRRLYAAIEHATECVLITDEHGTVEYVNPAFEKKFEHSREDICSLNPENAGPVVRGEEFYERLWKGVQERGTWKGRLRKARARGGAVEFETTSSPIFGSLGDCSGFVFIMRDVTEQKRMEERLIQSQKLEAIGTLASGIAHDFNNILGVIVGYTDLTLYTMSEGEGIKNNLRAVLSACDRAKNLIRQILAFGRRSEQRAMVMDLCPLIKESVRFLRAALPSNIEIRTRLEVESATVMADPVQIHQVVLNLGANAAHAMREKGGVLDVVARKAAVDQESSLRYPNLPPGDYLLLSFVDSGCGMSREVLSRIFEPFFTTKGEGEGTGLGLSVAHGVVQDHGGSIMVYSEEGKGSTFNVYLPLAGNASVEAGGADATPMAHAVGVERVLFVDDEPELVDICGQILQHLGYQVTGLTSSVEALRLFRSDPGGFDLVVTDQTIPHLSGMQLAEEVLAICPEIPVIVCTGLGIGASEERGRELGVRYVLMKPLDVRELAEKVRSALDGARGPRNPEMGP